MVMVETRLVATTVGDLAVVTGDTGNAAGGTAVTWHSLFVDDRSWDRVKGPLAEERRVIGINGPGHGSSADPGRRYTLTECADAAAQVLDALGVVEPVDWVGNAWGGHVGILFATAWPRRCRSLVTIGSPVQALSRKERVRTRFLLAAYAAVGPVEFIRSGVVDVLLSQRTRQQDPDATRLVHDCLSRMSRPALRNAVVSISLNRPDLHELLPDIAAPTLFLTGSDHQGWTPEQARAAVRLVADGSVAVIEGAAYLPPLEAPDETVELVRQFWRAHATTSPTGMG
jgi:pimeloyl-ACP methyl ester carboxylesterase